MSSSDRIPLEGVLNCWNDEHDLPDLLLSVCRNKKTGLLAFSNPEGDKSLHIRSGRIVFAESSSGDDGLGHYLLRTGKISLMDYLRVSKLVEPGKRLGALLVAEGVMEPNDLAPAVLGQVRSIILGLFRRTETWYRFREESLSSKTITLDLPVESLILDGVRQVESWRRISKGVGQLESQYRCIEEKKTEWEGAGFPPVVEELFETLRKPVSVAEICTQATLPDFEACRYLWAFRCLGWVEPLNEKPKTADVKATADPGANVDINDNAQPSQCDIATQPNVGQTARPGPHQPAATDPRPSPSSRFRRPTLIPQQLIQAQIAIEPPKLKSPTSSTGTTQRITPAPVIPDLERADFAVEAREVPSSAVPPQPPAETTEGAASKPPPVPAARAQTNLAIEPPMAPASSGEETHITASSETRVELAHTNLAVELSSAMPSGAPEEAEQEPAAAEEEEAEAKAVAEPAPKPEPERMSQPESEAMKPSIADVATGGLDQTQLFIEPPSGPGPSSTKETMESILSGQSSPDVRENEEGPAGFEALVFDDNDSSIRSIENPSMRGALSSPDFTAPEATPFSPEPAPVAASLGFEEEDAMASFQNLAYAPDPMSAALPPTPEPESERQPVVESTVPSEPFPVFEAEPEGPAVEPPIVTPPPPPPRKRGPDDDFDLDRDGFTHLITRNND